MSDSFSYDVYFKLQPPVYLKFSTCGRPLYVYYPYHLSGLLGDGTDEYISGLTQHHRKLQERHKRLMIENWRALLLLRRRTALRVNRQLPFVTARSTLLHGKRKTDRASDRR